MSIPSSCRQCQAPLEIESQNGLCQTCLLSVETEHDDIPVAALPSVFEGSEWPILATADAPTESVRPCSATADFHSAQSETTPSLIAPVGYEVHNRLGSGGMGDVYLVGELATGRQLAMKFLRCAGNHQAIERFQIEVLAQAALDHPNIIRIYSTDFFRADPYFTMEVADAGSLGKWIERHGVLSVHDAARLIIAVAQGVAEAHQHGILHRDLKPSNILLVRDPHHRFESTPPATDSPSPPSVPSISNLIPKVSDFGLAKRLDHQDGLTISASPLGTPGFMPPEQVSRRNGEVGPGSDVYGLGATLYYLLVGRPPFGPGNHDEVLHQVLTEPIKRPRVLRPEVPPELEGIVVKCLEKDPRDRYASAAELAADLTRFLAGEQPAAPSMTKWRLSRRWARRHRFRIAAAGMLIACAIGLLGAGSVLGSRNGGSPVDQVREVDSQPPAQPVLSEQELHDRFHREVQRELQLGRPVTLIGKNELPRWHEATTGPISFGKNPTGEGGCFFPSYQVTLMKLLNPPIDHYRFEAEIQHVKGPTNPRAAGTTFGLFVGHVRPVSNDDWQEQCTITVGFNDVEDQHPDRPGTSMLEVSFNNFVNRRGRHPSPHKVPFAMVPVPAATLLPGPWRKYIFEVSPERIRVLWIANPADPKNEPQVIFDKLFDQLQLYRDAYNWAFGMLSEQTGRVYAPHPEWSPRYGIGIWAFNSEIAVRNCILTPLTPPRGNRV